MTVNAEKQVVALNPNTDIPPHATRDYIIDMLTELCTVAKQSQQEDLLALLKLVTQAAQSVE